MAALAALTTGAVVRRINALTEYRNYAGDGRQYYKLAKSMVEQRRYSFGPDLGPAWSRLPGYPIFVAAAGWGAPRFNDADVGARVARSQAVLDAATGVLAFLVAWEVGLVAPAWLAVALCASSPLLAMSVCYVLSETLSVFLTTLCLYLLVRACRRRVALHLALAGAVLGAALLVRADSITLAPCFVVPLWFSSEARAARVRAAVLSMIAAAVVFAPWPIRNIVRCHAPHPLGSPWVTNLGDPLPMGPQAWLATWAVLPEHAARDVGWKMTRGTPLYAAALPPEASDSPEEKKRLDALLTAYDAAGLITPAVDEGFRELARDRVRAHPIRHFVILPLRRVRHLWFDAVPQWEMPFESPTLGLPAGRPALETLSHRTLALAALGLLMLAFVPLLHAGRPLAALAFAAALFRTIAIVLIVPGGTQRYVFELVPMMLVLSGFALFAPAELLLRRLLDRADAP